MFKTFLTAALAAFLVALPVVAVFLWAKPPDLLRVAAGYTAKVVCSNTFLSHRDPDDVLQSDVQAPGHPLLRFMRVSVDRDQGVVRAGLFGFIGGGLAFLRPGTGCAVAPDGRLGPTVAGPVPGPLPMPIASSAPPAIQGAPALQSLLEDGGLTGPGARAVVVWSDGRLVAEWYARGFDAGMPQLGWSMTKTVTAALIGVLVKDQRVQLDDPAGWPKGDPRGRITLADLMSMSSGLEFNEGYGAVSDATRMFYLEPDMAAFAYHKPLVHPPGQVWSYSSGAAVIVSHFAQNAEPGDVVTFVRTRLFEPLGMTSAVMETDESGTLVGSSYLYATPRDWARFGQFLLQDGVWEGREILPKGYVAMMCAPVRASGGEYGHGMVWRRLPHSDTPDLNPAAAFGIPEDAFWLSGHDGQYVAVIPSRRLVLVRMGLTPAPLHYRPEPLVRAVLDALLGGRAALTVRRADGALR